MRPRLRTILLASNLIVLLLPLGGLEALRLYESALIRQTESDLLGQGAILTAAFESAIGRAAARTAPTPLAARDWQPRTAVLDLAVDPVHPRAPEPAAADGAAEAHAAAAGGELRDVIVAAQLRTLSAIRLVDRSGIIVASTGGDVGRTLAAWDEVAGALRGEAVSLLRERVYEHPPPPFSSISRGARIRVFVALPAFTGSDVAGALVLSRSPRTLGETLWSKRRHLAAAAAALFFAVVVATALASSAVARPIADLVSQAKRVARGGAGAVGPLARPGTREVAELSEAVTRMAAALEERAHYVRDFASHVSHELKTPVTAIQGAIELVRDHEATMPPETRRRFLDNVRADARHIDRLVRRLLELARADVMRPGEARADAGAVLAAAANRWREAGLAVALEPPPPGTTAAIAPDVLESILATLLDNARQHGGEGVRVSLRGAIEDGRLALTVADDGPGVSAGNRERLFEPFFTTARDRGGTGLGLAIARSLLAAHHGTIALEPAAEGARFRIELPALALPAP